MDVFFGDIELHVDIWVIVTIAICWAFVASIKAMNEVMK